MTDFAALETALKFRPSIVTWSRLEPMSLTRGDLLPGLQALLGDPLWLLARQWQFEELRGEDGGSPVKVTVDGEHARMGRLHPGRITGDGSGAGAESIDMAPLQVPLEVAVEAETPLVLPERLRAEAGLHLLRMFAAADLGAVREATIQAYAFDAADADPQDPIGSERHRLLAGRVPDAARIAQDLQGNIDPDGTVTSLPSGIPGGGDAAGVRKVLTAWWAWFDGYLAGAAGNGSWIPHNLEYGFAVSSDLAAGPAVLRADEYANGTVDWYSFDAAGAPALGEPAAPAGAGAIHEVTIPSPARFPGMPSDRLWAFEDAAVYLGDLDAGPTDLARLALVEFSLVYGNDWFVVPIDLPAGSVTRLASVTVQDTFGKVIDVPPGRQASRPGWTMFHLPSFSDSSYLADLFVLPPTVRNGLESVPLEEVALFRDEMANLVWGVERIVQGPSGERVARGQLAARVSLRQQIPGDLDDAKIIYRLMTPVPEHWIPFVTVPATDTAGQTVRAAVDGEHFVVELERRPMVRFLDDGTVQLVHPHGQLLRGDPTVDVADDRLRVGEQEVPRDGIVMTRSYQLARSEDGRTVLWIGRAKHTGQGEGASGLRFDTALPPAGL